MAAQGNLKSASITNLDLTTPPFRPTAGGEGAHSYLYDQVGIVGPTTTAATTGGICRVIRLPSNAIVRAVYYCQLAATTTATFSFGLYYSDSTTDGTNPVNVAAAATALLATMWGSSIDTHAAVTWVDTTFANTSGFLPTDTVKPLWNATNSTLTADPGGYFDIGALNTATISGAATLLVRVQWCLAGAGF